MGGGSEVVMTVRVDGNGGGSEGWVTKVCVCGGGGGYRIATLLHYRLYHYHN
jgi:hypothetical protein